MVVMVVDYCRSGFRMHRENSREAVEQVLVLSYKFISWQ